MFCYREYGRGGNRFRLGSQKKRSIQGEENEKKSHQRLEEGGWEIIKTVSGIRKEGREAETTDKLFKNNQLIIITYSLKIKTLLANIRGEITAHCLRVPASVVVLFCTVYMMKSHCV